MKSLHQQIQNKTNHSIIKTLLVIFMVTVTAIFVSNFLSSFKEGYADKDKLPPLDVAEDDPELKCPATAKGCTPAEVMKLGYDLASDAAVSSIELENFKKVCQSRSPELAKMADHFIGHVTLLKFSTMLNTKSNIAEIQKKLDEMKKDATATDTDLTKHGCYNYKFMFEMAGLQVGTADQKTLSKVQSEAVRCYAQRFNAFLKCMGLCKSKK
jgi:hypothetical protein